MNYFYRNGHFDELFYVQYGKGIILTNYGDLTYKEGDYVVIPKGVIWKLENDTKSKVLIVESVYPIETPSKFRNRFGQLLESSPFCERDIITPTLKDPINDESDYLVKVRLNEGIQAKITENQQTIKT